MPRFTAFYAVLICLLSSQVLAERYSVEEDSFGGYTAKKVDNADHPVKAPANLVSQPEAASELTTQETREPDTPPTQTKLDDGQPGTDTKSGSADDQVANQEELNHELIGNVGDKLSPFEREFIKGEERERARVLDALKNAPKSEPYDATAVNPVEFVDGDELLKGKRPESERSSYYTVVDADGTVRNITYDLEAVEAAMDEAQKKKIEFTEANILNWSSSNIELPESADPFAARLFAQNTTSADYFKRFSESCCDRLPNVEVKSLIPGKSLYFEINEDQLAYRFSGGDSRFLLLRLPKTYKALALKLNSYIRAHKFHGVENGVFFPQLVTLDEDKKPLRIFTGPLLKYHPETWVAHGFLQGLFQIDTTESGAERFLLINTTRDILRQSSSIDDSEGFTHIDHMGIGTIEVELMAVEQ